MGRLSQFIISLFFITLTLHQKQTHTHILLNTTEILHPTIHPFIHPLNIKKYIHITILILNEQLLNQMLLLLLLTTIVWTDQCMNEPTNDSMNEFVVATFKQHKKMMNNHNNWRRQITTCNIVPYKVNNCQNMKNYKRISYSN